MTAKIENCPGKIRESIDVIIEHLKGFSIQKEDGFRIKLCLYEALGNCYAHGNQRDSNKVIALDVRLFRSRVVVRISDESKKAFDLRRHFPEDQNALNGRGIPILLENTDRVSFQQNIGALRLEFQLSYGLRA